MRQRERVHSPRHHGPPPSQVAQGQSDPQAPFAREMRERREGLVSVVPRPTDCAGFVEPTGLEEVWGLESM